ncbi:lanosterol synthase-like isoform X2 [Zophobas morio]|uniref:lanosterol synthase-like isoform X2 n=1 Tax=Zophobas morio TaxID=2755281 RepID=UPI003083CDA7
MFRGDSAPPKGGIPPATKFNNWYLEVCEGRQVWHYVTDELTKIQKERFELTASPYHVGLPKFATPEESGSPFYKVPSQSHSYEEVLRKGVSFFGKLQTKDGHWAGDYGTQLLLYKKQPICEPFKLEILRYLFNVQNEDGGWGLHIESTSTMFGSVLNYISARLLGLTVEDKLLHKAKCWIQSHGNGSSCLASPQWGKVYLAILNIISWDAVNSLIPELILLPEIFPFHIKGMWSYARTVYMPMTYLYGIRFQVAEDDLIRQLRTELLPSSLADYASIQWSVYRNIVAEEDLYTPHTRLLKYAFKFFNAYEYIAPSFLRRRALARLYEVGVRKESEFTKYICIGPVNKVLNTLVTWIVEGPESVAFQKHLERLPDYLWMGTDGMKMNGTNGSQLWDTAFMVQALMENSKNREEYRDIFSLANDFLDISQIRVNHPEHWKYYRDETKGGWPFSTRDVGWLVADTTGEGLKASLLVKRHGYSLTPLDDSRLFDALNILLLMQNSTGGYATCEKTRGSKLFEYLNASEVFGDIMIDYDYVECTSSALQALVTFHEHYPTHRKQEVLKAVERATAFILKSQHQDGSFEGMWGICFTYGTWFALDGLASVGLYYENNSAVRKACKFLLSRQMMDGGWGESFLSCVRRTYVNHKASQIINTAWAVLALLGAHYPQKEPIKRGIDLLKQRQLLNGDWPQESICGVFNKNCMINYSNFKNIFPIWALARFTERYPQESPL